MNKYVKIMGVMTLSLLLTNCASQYKIKTEKSKVLNEVPKWYVNDFSDKKACDTPTFGKNKDKMCIFGVGTRGISRLTTCDREGHDGCEIRNG